jgi:hypothetical protein
MRGHSFSANPSSTQIHATSSNLNSTMMAWALHAAARGLRLFDVLAVTKSVGRPR